MFRTPTWRKGNATGPLTITQRQGVAVIINQGQITERKWLLGDEHLTADHIFLGGRENLVTDPALHDLLTNAGYELVEA